MSGKYFKRLISLLFLQLLLIMSSCQKESPVQAKQNTDDTDTLKPGSRDYVWDVDTLRMPMNLLDAIWGSSPEDVWAVGAGGRDWERLFHFDGSKWNQYTDPSFTCCGATIFGFSRDNVWMAGDDGKIWHYDGIKWCKFQEYFVPGAKYVHFTRIFGLTNDDVYACGLIFYDSGESGIYKGFLMHYDGKQWKTVNIGAEGTQYVGLIKGSGDEGIYIHCYSSLELSQYMLLKYLNGGIIQLYSSAQEGFFNINKIGENVYFRKKTDFYIISDNSLAKQFSIEGAVYPYHPFGRNNKDIFITKQDGLLHYNGSDITEVLKFPENTRYNISGNAIFEKDIFCAIYDGYSGRNLILHGKQKAKE